jgi:hypothetical protein
VRAEHVELRPQQERRLKMDTRLIAIVALIIAIIVALVVFL